MKDAVCCECQHTIAKGAFLDRKSGDYIMVCHPAAGVFIDTKTTAWKVEYIPSMHANCRGAGTVPQHVFPD